MKHLTFLFYFFNIPNKEHFIFLEHESNRSDFITVNDSWVSDVTAVYIPIVKMEHAGIDFILLYRDLLTYSLVQNEVKNPKRSGVMNRQISFIHKKLLTRLSLHFMAMYHMGSCDQIPT